MGIGTADAGMGIGIADAGMGIGTAVSAQSPPLALPATSPSQLPPSDSCSADSGEEGSTDEIAWSSDGGDDDHDANIPMISMLEPHTVVCKTDGEVLVLAQTMLPYLLHRDRRPLLDYLATRDAALPADAAIATHVRTDERKRKTTRAVNISEKQNRTSIATFWPGTRRY
jgi:hypothetical protein